MVEKTKTFLMGNLTKNYFIVFLPFLIIISLVFVIQLSVLSAKINLSFMELLTIFSYTMPEIFFSTIPLAFIAAVTNTFAKLSEENELIALFALGHSPGKLFRYLLPLTILVVILLLSLSLLMQPLTKQHLDNFKNQKIAEAKLKVLPKKLSQNFGDYHIFIENTEDGYYKNLTLFINDKKGFSQIFLAKKGKIENNGTVFTLKLFNGTGSRYYPEKIESVRYKKLYLYHYPQSCFYHYENISSFWMKAIKDRHRRSLLYYSLFISFSPLLTLGILMALGTFNPRYKRNRSFWIIFFVALGIYIPAAVLQKYPSTVFFLAAITLWAIVSVTLYRKYLLKRF